MYELITTSHFDRKLSKLIKGKKVSILQIEKILNCLRDNPFKQSLKTHKVNLKSELLWSSRINGDLRIIWKFEKEGELKLLLLDIGGHSGKNAVY
jgi:mRNA-degrading endonuclease YafQ of YafQ-DinJ toxin-antitoxin module